MEAIITLSLMGLIITFLSGILSEIPFQGVTYNVEDVEDVRDFEKVGEQLFDVYKTIVDDLVTFRQDPSLERAEGRSQALVAAAGSIQASFQSFASEFQEKLDELIKLFNTDNQTPVSDNQT